MREVFSQAHEGHNRFDRPWAGLRGQALTAALAQNLKISKTSAMIIIAIHLQSPFQDAGFVVGEVIKAVDNKSVGTLAEILYRFFAVGIGGSAQIKRVTAKSSDMFSADLISAPNVQERKSTEFDERSVFPKVIVFSKKPTVDAELNMLWGSIGSFVVESCCITASVWIRRGIICFRRTAKI